MDAATLPTNAWPNPRNNATPDVLPAPGRMAPPSFGGFTPESNTSSGPLAGASATGEAAHLARGRGSRLRSASGSIAAGPGKLWIAQGNRRVPKRQQQSRVVHPRGAQAAAVGARVGTAEASPGPAHAEIRDRIQAKTILLGPQNQRQLDAANWCRHSMARALPSNQSRPRDVHGTLQRPGWGAVSPGAAGTEHGPT